LTSAAPIRTFLIDDHPVVISGAKALIDSSDDIICVGSANNAAKGQALANELRPDVTVIDISLPDASGLTVAHQIIQAGHSSHVVMMTLHDEHSYVQQALQIGVKAFVQKRSASENLLLAIRSVMLGGLFLDPPTAQEMTTLAADQNPSLAGAVDSMGLTSREQNVLRMVALGYSNKEIAARMNISIKSVETYKARATEKLRLNSRAQIVRFAITHGWINGNDA
jgi:DNA-binding NarL/FixJ family response regulator